MQTKIKPGSIEPSSRSSELQGLRSLFPGQLLTHPVDMLTYEMDAAIDRGVPEGVLFPESVEDVVKVVRWAARAGVPLVARGAGTGLSGGAVAEHGGLIIEFSRLNHIQEFDPKGRAVCIEPGLVNLKLDEFVKKAGLYFPPDPASGRAATLGGNLAENAGGPHCFKYGVMTNYVTGLQVVLADGRIVRFGGAAYDYPEYDFSGVLTGSEGTLGIIVQAWLRLLRNPPGVKTLMAAFESVEDAGQAVSAIIANGLVPATMEFMDRKMMRIIEDYAHAGLPVEAEAALIIEVDGYPDSLQPQMAEILGILQEQDAFGIRVAQTAEERDRIWYGRKSAAGAMARLSPAYYLLDGTVPRSLLAEALTEVNRICNDLELRVAYVFHAGDGNLHPFILIENPNDPELMQRIFQAGERIMHICVERQGSITGEHGVGIEKRRFMPLMYNQNELNAMLDVKAVFDPAGLLNPGKIFPQAAVSAEPNADLESETLLTRLPTNTEFIPASNSEVVEIFRAANRKGATIRLRGGGTKSAWLPPANWIVSSGRLNCICAYAPQDLYVTTQAGMSLAELQAELIPNGMWVPLVSPWEKSTIGGMLSTNFNAPLRMRYGGLRDLVLAVTAVLPDGRLVKMGRPVVKNVAGYDLSKLFIGAHGTLGFVTEATLKVVPLPRCRKSLLIPLDDLRGGIEIGQRLVADCLVASGLLLISNSQYPQCQELETRAGIAPYYLLYTAEGLPEDVDTELAQVRKHLQKFRQSACVDFESISASELWTGWMRSVHEDSTVVRLGLPPKDLAQMADLFSDRVNFLVDLPSGMSWFATEQNSDWGVFSNFRKRAQALGGYLVILPSSSTSLGANEIWGYHPESITLMERLKSRWDAQRLVNPGGFLL